MSAWRPEGDRYPGQDYVTEYRAEYAPGQGPGQGQPGHGSPGGDFIGHTDEWYQSFPPLQPRPPKNRSIPIHFSYKKLLIC